MNKAILSLSLLLSVPALAVQEIPSNPLDQQLADKLVSVIGEVKIQGLLEQTAEFNECRDKYKYEEGMDPRSPKARAKAQQAEDCFKQKLTSGKSADQLNELSQKLGLEKYGLVQSKNVKEISDFLGDQLYKSLTGVDREEEKRNIKLLEFKNRKMVDQRIFFELQTTQLAKNALLEVSRFCFENFRKAGGGTTSVPFSQHWSDFLANGAQPGAYTDSGKPEFTADLSKEDKSDLYAQIKENIAGSTNVDPERLGEFFAFCGSHIRHLCDHFEQKQKNSQAPPVSAEVAPDKGALATFESTDGAACIAQDRLKKIRNAIAQTQQVLENFDKDQQGGIVVELDNGQKAQFYDPGNAGPNDNIDGLTNIASVDLLEGGKSGEDELAEKCEQNPQTPECEGFFVLGDSRNQAEHAIDTDMRLKKQVEMARVRELKAAGEASLKEYLEQQGHFDILEKLKEDPNYDVVAAIGNSFDAKREALLAEIQNKLGSRQMTQEELDDKNTTKDAMIKKNAQESKEERARLAQVVFFNNLITSHLVLRDKDTNQETGRNTGALAKELSALEEHQINGDYFTNLKDTIGGGNNGESGKNHGSVVGLSLLDQILGKPEESN